MDYKAYFLIASFLLTNAANAQPAEIDEELSWWERSQQQMNDWWNSEESAELNPTSKSSDAPPVEQQPNWWERSQQQAGEWWNQTFQTVEEENAAFRRVWEDINPRLNGLLELDQEQANLPVSAWFERDQQDNRQDMDQLLDEAVGILGFSNSNQLRDQIQSLEDDIQTARQKIDDYRQRKITAPTQSTWKTTVSDYNDKIADLQQQISEQQRQIDAAENRIFAKP